MSRPDNLLLRGSLRMECSRASLHRSVGVIMNDLQTNTPEVLSPAPGRDTDRTLVCFSHLRWHFVLQRPQHLMTRFARVMRVFFVEEWVATDAPEPHLDLYPTDVGVTLVVPRLPRGLEGPVVVEAQRVLIDQLWAEQRIVDPIIWYYTPMSGAFSDHLEADAIVYDCMDELTGFIDCPPEMIAYESELFTRADLVFTGGYSLYEAKRSRHRSVHAFPSSVDVKHFRRARTPGLIDPPDQKDIPHPRFGFYGVIEERLDIAFLAAIAAARPEWHFVVVGPVVRIDPAALPRRANIHYLGGKRYEELPAYLAGWDVAMMPFALNASTRFISPTKTPEFLAAGKPVISTPIKDVVRTYGDEGAGLVAIAGTPEEFVAAGEKILAESADRREWLTAVDRTLAAMSWDETWSRMANLINRVSSCERGNAVDQIANR
jgi:glycosyltransferase involved in cell wall biosynthesis